MTKIEVLLVTSRRSTFSRHVLKRSDVRIGFLRFSDDPDAERFDAPTFTLNREAPLKDESIRFLKWGQSVGFNPKFFCNPNEQYQSVAQAFAKEVGLPHLTQYQVSLVRNKVAMKDFYNTHNIPCAKYTKVKKADDILDFARKSGFPVIVKPVDSDSCIDTYRVNNTEELPKLSEKYDWMVEQYVKATEYQICAIVAQGKVVDAFIARNPAPILEVFDGAINANITLAPSEKKPIDPKEVMQNIASKMNISYGYLHGEFFVRP